MDINDRVARCRLIASIIVADDEVTEEELAFLEKAMQRLGLTEQDKAKAMVLFDESEAKAALSALGRDDRLAFLKEMADAAWVDNNIDEYEVERIQELASAMNLSQEDIDAALAQAQADSGNA